MGNHRFLPSNLKPMAWIYRLREMGRSKTRSKKMNKQTEANSIAEPPSPAAPQRRRPSVRLSTSGEDAPIIPPPDYGQFPDSEAPVRDGSPFSLPAEPPRKSSRAPPLRVRTPCRCSCHSIANEESSFPGRFRKHLRPTPAEPVGRGKQTSAAARCGGGRATEGVATPRRSTKGPGVRVKMRLSSPRIGRGKVRTAAGARRSVESVAIAKASRDPQRDFRESMVAMVVEYGIREPGELEDLLAGYLSLNSEEYHGLIVSVFQEIWFLLNHGPPAAP